MLPWWNTACAIRKFASGVCVATNHMPAGISLSGVEDSMGPAPRLRSEVRGPGGGMGDRPELKQADPDVVPR